MYDLKTQFAIFPQYSPPHHQPRASIKEKRDRTTNLFPSLFVVYNYLTTTLPANQCLERLLSARPSLLNRLRISYGHTKEKWEGGKDEKTDREDARIHRGTRQNLTVSILVKQSEGFLELLDLFLSEFVYFCHGDICYCYSGRPSGLGEGCCFGLGFCGGLGRVCSCPVWGDRGGVPFLIDFGSKCHEKRHTPRFFRAAKSRTAPPLTTHLSVSDQNAENGHTSTWTHPPKPIHR